MPDAASPPPFDPSATSLHIQKAALGDAPSAGWLVARFSPLLGLQARYRLKGPLLRTYDPVDIVQDVWASVLPHLTDLSPRDGRWTPVLMKYLATTLLRRLNTLLRDEVRGIPDNVGLRTDASDLATPRSKALATAFESAARDEAREHIASCLEKLSPKSREVIVLRGIEQMSNDAVALRLSESKSTISMRYARALEALRSCLPRSVFDEFDD